ncbi:MAG: hypothetical protein H6509_10910 [Bryobacterales bacterium]|nr:hypothetical protein [Bryobacterales bacterium]
MLNRFFPVLILAATVAASSCSAEPPQQAGGASSGQSAPLDPDEPVPTMAPPPVTQAPQTAPAPSQANGQVMRLKQFEIMDPTGFGRPVVAATLLAPSDWKLEGGVRWSIQSNCPSDMVSNAVRLTSPDGKMGFEIFPNYMAQWSDDPSYNQLVMQAQQMGGAAGCPLAQPMDAQTFVSRIFAPGFRQGAQVVDAQDNRDVAAEAYQKVAAQQTPGSGTRVDIDAMRFRIAYGDQEEWIVTTLARMTSPGMTLGGVVNNYITFTDRVIGFRAPRGQLDANQALFGTMIASIRVNPQWQQAINNTFRKIAQINAQGARDRARSAAETSRIIAQTGDEIREMSAQSWRRQQDSQDRVANQWSQTMRGVETYTDPGTGSSWELESGYNRVWKTSGDEFLLTNDVNFDPNVSLPDTSWTQMQTAP